MIARSLAKLTKRDLLRLRRLAASDRADLFARKPEIGRLYANRLFAVALCQGAALHYVDGTNGVKDFDVWSFYTEHPRRPFPYRRHATADFGHPKFGTTRGTRDYIGRRVDLLGRSIRGAQPSDPVGSLREYLRAGKTASAQHLALKAVILIEPDHLLGTVVWP
jgi:hypothetical protein